MATSPTLRQRGNLMAHTKAYEHARRKLGVKKGSPVGALMEKSQSMVGKKMPKRFMGKSTNPGMGGRAKILKAKGVPKGVIGAIARSKGEAPGQKGFHGGKK